MRYPDLTMSGDGAYRANLNVTYRLTLDEMARALSQHISRFGVKFNDDLLTDEYVITRLNFSNHHMFSLVREALEGYGLTATYTDNVSDELLTWAQRQIKNVFKEQLEKVAK